MKAFILWLMGDSLGQMTIDSWQWLWNINPQPAPSTPSTSETVNAADRDAVGRAEASITAMQTRITELENAVKQVVAAAKLAREQYTAKYQQWQDLEAQALAAQTQGNVPEARLAMSQAMIVDRILPQMLERVERAQDLAQAAQTKLAQERESLTIGQTEIETIKAMVAMNQSLIQTEEFSKLFQEGSPANRFEKAQEEIEHRNKELEAMYELTTDDKSTFSNSELDDAIAKKLGIHPLLN